MSRPVRSAVSWALIVPLMVATVVVVVGQPAYALTTVNVAVNGTGTHTPGAGEQFSDPVAGDPSIVDVSIVGGALTINCKGAGATLVKFTVRKGTEPPVTRVILVTQGTTTVTDDGVKTIPLNTPQRIDGTYMHGFAVGFGDIEESTNRRGRKRGRVTVSEGGAFVYALYTDNNGALHVICYTAAAQKGNINDDRRDQQEGEGDGDF